jgi:hypothetical protein
LCQALRQITSCSSLNRRFQVTKSSQILEITDLAEGFSFLKITPFLASQRRQRIVWRTKGHSFFKFAGIEAFHTSTSERATRLGSCRRLQTAELTVHSKKTCRLSSTPCEQRSHKASSRTCLDTRFSRVLNLSLKYNQEKILTLAGTREVQIRWACTSGTS